MPFASAADNRCGENSRFRLKTLKMQLLHSSDNESSFQDPNTLEPKILNYATVVEGLRKYAKDEKFEYSFD